MTRSSHDTPPVGRGPASPVEPVPDGSAAAGHGRPARTGALVEWAIWLLVVGVFYLQTARFDDTIASYRLGATGWPRALAVCAALGATGQLVYRLTRGAEAAGPAVAARERLPLGTLLQRAGIFVLPLVWLWLIPSIGFYVATPLFVIALMLILEVRSPLAILGVTTVVWGLLLVIFTRFFYVGLPTGSIDLFYDMNNWIIATARWGR